MTALAALLKWIWANTEPLTKWIQVLALSVAAYWTYTRFLVGEKPSLETRLDITSSLRWEDPGPSPGTCYVFFDVEVTSSRSGINRASPGEQRFELTDKPRQCRRGDSYRGGQNSYTLERFDVCSAAGSTMGTIRCW